MSSPRISLFVKLMGALLAAVLLVGLLAAGLAPRAIRTQFQLYVDNSRRRQADVLANILSDYYAQTGDWEGADAILNNPLPNAAQGNQQGNGRNQNSPRRPPDRDIWRAIGAHALIVNNNGVVIIDSNGEMEGETVGKQARQAGSPIIVNDKQVGALILAVESQASIAQELFLQQMNRVIIIAVMVAGVAALLLGALMTWGIIRPLRQLTAAAEAITEGDLSQRVPAEANDELGDLARAFNNMSGRLDRSETLRRQLTADIAHELRTPLTVIQGNIEALQDGIFPFTPDSLTPIADKTQLLSRLIEDLRQLALAEAGQLYLDRQPTDVGELVKRVAAAFLPVARAQDITLRVETEENLGETAVDSQRIEQVLNNLLANALRHTPGGGSVTIECVAAPNAPLAARRSLLVTITDTGDGIPPDMLHDIFERFTRADKGRARTDDGGTGLGLAVAQTIIQAHSGDIGAQNNADGGAMFWFTLPTEVGAGRRGTTPS